MKNNKAFTLIELLAVIVILSILLIIGIPTVTEYILKSRKSTYVSIAESYIDAVRRGVSNMEYSLNDNDTMYYIPVECIELEKKESSKSPFGEWVEAYVVVTYKTNGYQYYWTSIDDTGTGMKLSNATHEDNINVDSVQSNLKPTDIQDLTQFIDGKTKITEFDKTTCKKIVLVD